MAGYADDVSVPEPENENHMYGDNYGRQGDLFGLGVLKAGSQDGILTRSVSRKRLSPEALAAGEHDMVPGNGSPQRGIVDDPGISALMLAYRSYPGLEHAVGALRVHPRLRNAVSRPGSGVFARVVRDPAPSGAPLHQRPTQIDPAQQQHEVPELRPRLGPEHTVVTATTAGSAFAEALSSDGHVPSSVQPPGVQPYSELLTGPAFSYAADGDGVFDADGISLGSLASGSYMMGDDDADDGNDGTEAHSDADSGQLLRSLSISTVCSGSGERFDATAQAAVAPTPEIVTWAASNPLPLGSVGRAGALGAAAVAASGRVVRAADAILHAAAPAVGSNSGGGPGVAIAATTSAVAAIAPLPHLRFNFCEGPVAAGAGSQAGPVNEAADTVDEDLTASLPVRSGSVESVGSAHPPDPRVPSSNSATHVPGAAGTGDAALPHPLADSLSAAGACEPRPRAGATPAAVAAVAAALLAPPGLLGAQPLPGAAFASAPVAGISAWPAVGMPFVGQVPTPPLFAAPAAPPAVAALVAGPGTAAACGPVIWAAPGQVPGLGPTSMTTAGATAATLPLAAAAAASPPSLLPPDVYLGFVSQLVESVRTAARAVDDAYQAERQQHGFAGYYVSTTTQLAAAGAAGLRMPGAGAA